MNEIRIIVCERKRVEFENHVKMYIYDILHKEKVYQTVAVDLRNLGVKYRLKKNAGKAEKTAERSGNLSRKLFKTPLSLLPLDVVNLSSGAIVHIPTFVSKAVSFLQQFLTQEGLFRKAGSQIRQKELISRIDNGGLLGDKNNAIDVANCLKTFFRQLPEPLIPHAYQDLFIRCGMLKTGQVQALLLACILLPPHHLNTLAFLMEFLKNVATHEKQNKMGVDNLAKIFVPNVMPLQETTMIAMQSRLEAHLIIVKILIENAEQIGVLPENIAESISAEFTGSTDFELDGDSYLYAKYKKKKHRSGSLTRKPHLSASNLNLRMLSGLKKMVGKNNLPVETETINEIESTDGVLYTPSHKTGKKRKVAESVIESTNLTKHLLRDKSSLQKVKITKNTSHKINLEVRIMDKVDKSKKIRLSLDKFVQKGKHKNSEHETEKYKVSESPCIERRWSSASNSCKTPKKHPIQRKDSASLGSLLSENDSLKPRIQQIYDDVLLDADVNLSDSSIDQAVVDDERRKSEKRIRVNAKRRSLSALLSERSRNRSANRHKLESSEMLYKHEIKRTKSTDSILPSYRRNLDKNSSSEEYVRIPKSEYEEIKNRVSAIETRISQEFGNIVKDPNILSVDSVQNEYEKTLEEASIESTISADHLAKKMSKNLKIRRSAEHKIFRSPSARKIGSIRRRSQEKIPRRRVSRTASWHSADRPSPHTTSVQRPRTPLNNVYMKSTLNPTQSIPLYTDLHEPTKKIISSCSDETNARLDYLQEQLHTLISQTVEHTRNSLSDEDLCLEDEVFTSNEVKLNSTLCRTSSFHDNSQYFNKKLNELKMSNNQQTAIDENSTTNTELEMWRSAGSYFAVDSPHIRTPVPQTGRASVAKLRAQNAGMVLAKAKLFDDTTVKHSAQETHAERTFASNQESYRRQLTKFQPRLREIKNSDTAVSPVKKNKVGSMQQLKTSPKNGIMKSRSPQTPSSRRLTSYRSPLEFERSNPREVKYKSAIHQKENETETSVYNPDVDGCKTPHIKKPLLVKTPRSAKLARRPTVEIKRTPMKAVPIVTPKRSSPTLKARYMKQQMT